MRLKAFFMSAVLFAAAGFSSCGKEEQVSAENNLSELFSVGEAPAFISVSVGKSEPVTASFQLDGMFSETADDLFDSLASAALTERPDPYDLPAHEGLQINVMRNISTEQTEPSRIECCTIEFYKDGITGIFRPDGSGGDTVSYEVSSKDYKAIRKAAEKIIDERTSYPQLLRIIDPLSSNSCSGASVAPAGISWNYIAPDRHEQNFVADALHPLDIQASVVKVGHLYSSWAILEFPAGFEPDNIKIVGWDISKKGDTSSETISHPKTEYENNFPSAGDYTGMFQLESNTIYRVTVTYDNTRHGKEGFRGSADYYFETGDLGNSL